MFDEADGIVRAADELLAEAGGLIGDGVIGAVELVLIDDGSSDDTVRTVHGLARTRDEVVVVAHERNRGLGAGVRTGLAHARHDLVLYTDADLPAPVGSMRTAIELAAVELDRVISAYRTRRLPDGMRRLVYSIVYNGLVRALFSLHVRDVNFAYKVVRRSNALKLDLRSEGSFIDAELLVAMKRAGFTIEQFPVVYRPRLSGRSTLSRFPVVVDITREAVTFGRRTGWRR